MRNNIEGFLPDDNFFVDFDWSKGSCDCGSDDNDFFDKPEKPKPKPDEDNSDNSDDDESESKPELIFTTFKELYDFFLAGITDDMFMELTIEDTKEILQEIMLAALPYFEFARHDLFDMDLEYHRFNFKLTVEEMMIIRQYMIAQWIGYQIATVDLIRQKYSGSDFKFTSQASHIKQLQTMKKEYETQGFHLQRLYKRREKKEDGRIGSTMAMIMESPKS